MNDNYEKKIVRDVSLEAAMEALKKAEPLAVVDTVRPLYHLIPPACWMNDPNGAIYYHGWYHLFYLHDPFSDDGESWADINGTRIVEGKLRPNRYWGHARSRDLVNWEHLPLAIGPLWAENELKPISGSTTLSPAGQPMIFYTSVKVDSIVHTQCAAFSDQDLINWSRISNNPVLSIGNYDGPVFDPGWRDPFVFCEEGRYFMIIGAELEGDSVLPIFESDSDDLQGWKYRGIMFRKPKDEIKYFECPKFLKLDGKWVLITSPYGPVQYFIGDFNLENYTFRYSVKGLIDYSQQHYATENIMDDEGKVWIMGWLPGWKKELNNGKGWNGCFSLPRILSIHEDGSLLQKPAPQLESLRKDKVKTGHISLQKKSCKLKEISAECMEIQAVLHAEQGACGTLRLFSHDNSAVFFDINISSNCLKMDDIEVPINSLSEQRGLCLHIFVDRCIVEIFVNNGQACVTKKIHQYKGGPWEIELISIEGLLKAKVIEVWRL